MEMCYRIATIELRGLCLVGGLRPEADGRITTLDRHGYIP